MPRVPQSRRDKGEMIMEVELAARRERLLDLGFSELEIADLSDAMIGKLQKAYRNAREMNFRGSTNHIASRHALIFTALQVERKLRNRQHAAPVESAQTGKVSEYFVPRQPTAEEIFNSAVGSNIAEQRVETHHSVDWLAHALSCSHRRIEQMEAGEIAVGTKELAKIAIALGVTILDLVPSDLRRRLQKPAPVVPSTPGQSPPDDQSLPASAAA